MYSTSPFHNHRQDSTILVHGQNFQAWTSTAKETNLTTAANVTNILNHIYLNLLSKQYFHPHTNYDTPIVYKKNTPKQHTKSYPFTSHIQLYKFSFTSHSVIHALSRTSRSIAHTGVSSTRLFVDSTNQLNDIQCVTANNRKKRKRQHKPYLETKTAVNLNNKREQCHYWTTPTTHKTQRNFTHNQSHT